MYSFFQNSVGVGLEEALLTAVITDQLTTVKLISLILHSPFFFSLVEGHCLYLVCCTLKLRNRHFFSKRKAR